MENELESSKQPTSGNLSIGTVAKLTGVSVHTLRAWEKRHSVVSVLRSDTGRRLYRPEDVYRLRLLRKLTMSGHSIGNIASLDDAQLEQMLDLEHHTDTDTLDDSPRVEVCLFSDRRLENFHIDDAIRRQIDIVHESSEVGELRDLISAKKSLVVVMIFSTIQKHQLRLLRQLRDVDSQHDYFIVFTFAPREVLDELNAMDFKLLRAPIGYDQLFRRVLEARQIRTEHSPSANKSDMHFDEVPPHRFTKRQLEGLAGMPTAIACECPQRLSSLIQSLTVFEGYSQQCAVSHKEDAEMHNEIYKKTAQARHLLESAIMVVMEAENISLDLVGGDH